MSCDTHQTALESRPAALPLPTVLRIASRARNCCHDNFISDRDAWSSVTNVAPPPIAFDFRWDFSVACLLWNSEIDRWWQYEEKLGIWEGKHVPVSLNFLMGGSFIPCVFIFNIILFISIATNNFSPDIECTNKKIPFVRFYWFLKTIEQMTESVQKDCQILYSISRKSTTDKLPNNPTERKYNRVNTNLPYQTSISLTLSFKQLVGKR